MEAIREAIDTHSLLCFANQPMTDEAHLAFTRRLGEPEAEHVTLGKTGEVVHFGTVGNVSDDGSVQGSTHVRTRYQVGNQMWHADSSFRRVPSFVSITHACEVPGEGGGTSFASMRHAYAGLPADMQAMIDPLHAIHDYVFSRTQVAPVDPSHAASLPPVVHKLVRTNPAQRTEELLRRLACTIDRRLDRDRKPQAPRRPARAGNRARGHLHASVAGRRYGDLGQPLPAAPRHGLRRRPLAPPDAPDPGRRSRPDPRGEMSAVPVAGEPVPTISRALVRARDALGATSDTARLDAEVLLAHVLGWSRARIHAHGGERLDPAMAMCFHALVERRRGGEPIAYLTGYREFWSLELAVTPDTLIPRPETEHLVEAVLGLVPPGGDATIADIGTGSGAIALAVASERPGAFVLGSDRSRAAVAVARANADRIGCANASFIVADACVALAPGRWSVVVSNPPYVAAGDPHLDAGDVRFEPRDALVSRPRGLDHAGVARPRGPVPAGARRLARAGARRGAGAGRARVLLALGARIDRNAPRSGRERAGDGGTARPVEGRPPSDEHVTPMLTRRIERSPSASEH